MRARGPRLGRAVVTRTELRSPRWARSGPPCSSPTRAPPSAFAPLFGIATFPYRRRPPARARGLARHRWSPSRAASRRRTRRRWRAGSRWCTRSGVKERAALLRARSRPHVRADRRRRVRGRRSGLRPVRSLADVDLRAPGAPADRARRARRGGRRRLPRRTRPCSRAGSSPRSAPGSPARRSASCGWPSSRCTGTRVAAERDLDPRGARRGPGRGRRAVAELRRLLGLLRSEPEPPAPAPAPPWRPRRVALLVAAGLMALALVDVAAWSAGAAPGRSCSRSPSPPAWR